ncbi:MAG: hypothetical protein DRJ97_07775 [Thermoprotei archaeon]|nr:MAG: hypothetical protein DRJ97_07775 [Thermoprotei archaeon]
MIGMEDVMEKLAVCMQCGACVGSCPVTGLNEFNVRRLARRAYLGWAGQEVLKEEVWLCLLCARCYENCPRGINLPEVMVRLRQQAVKQGLVPRTVSLTRSNLSKYGNPAGVEAKELMEWASDLNVPKSGDRLFYAGFYLLADHIESMVRSMLRVGIKADRVAAAAALLQRVGLGGLVKAAMKGVGLSYRQTLKRYLLTLPKLGLEVSYLYDEEPWVGTELHTYGFLEDFAEHAKRVYALLKERGIKEIVTPDPIAAVTFKKLYPEYVDGFSIEVKTVVEALAEKKPEFKAPVEAKVVFHDPCMLARYLRVVEEPRTLLTSIPGLDLNEPVRNKQFTVCCGAGGLEVVNPSLAREVAVKSVQNLLSTNASLVVSACPMCTMMLKLGVEKLGAKAEVVDLGDILWKALAQEA